MQDYLPSVDFLIGGVVVGLILAGVSAYFKRRKLYIIVPKLFSHSELSSSGQVIELNVRNKGARTEEDIRVALNPKLSYEVIASTLPGLTVSHGGVIHIQRLSKSEEVSIVLTAEQGEFLQDSVLSISSKETKGEIKKKTQDAEDTTALEAAIVLTFVFLFMPAVGYFGGNIIMEEIVPKMNTEVERHQALKASLSDSGWDDINRFVDSDTFTSFGGEWPFNVSFPTRNGELLVFSITFKNKTAQVMEVSVYTRSVFDDKEFYRKNGYWPDDSVSSFLIPSGAEVQKSIETYLPYESENKVVRFDFFIETESNAFNPSYTWVSKENDF